MKPTTSELPTAIARAHGVVAAATGDPLFPTVALCERHALGLDHDPRVLFATWAARSTGSPLSAVRYRWALSTRDLGPTPAYMGNPSSWRPWRPAETELMGRDPDAVFARLVVPLVLAETVEFLGSLASDEETEATVREQAREFLREAMPVLRTDGAFYVGGRHAWGDTFALWCFARAQQALRVFFPYALATAELYAEAARTAGGWVLGSRFPFHDRALVSASAQLATGLLAIGLHPDLVGTLARHVGEARDESGGWGDAGGPADLLTTLAAASLLARLDPTFDLTSTVRFFLERQAPDGWWRAMGPETLWLTAEVARFLDDAARPFAARFRWPQLARENRDHRTGLPFFAYLVDLANVCAQVPGLGAAPIEIAFTDLAGFGDFNNRAGMAMGDEVLRLYAAELRTLADAVAIRDGGDEFIVVGAPTGSGMRERMEEFRTRQWPEAFRHAFGEGVDPVAPRILVTASTAASLVRAREELGRAIGPWKKQIDPVPSTGALWDLGMLTS